MSAPKSDYLWKSRPLHKLKKSELREALEQIASDDMGGRLEEIGLTLRPMQPRISLSFEEWAKVGRQISIQAISLLRSSNEEIQRINESFPDSTEQPTSENTCASGAKTEPQN